MTPEDFAALRRPFDPKTVGKLPKGNTTLDFVGHAAVTDRLLAVDPTWSWEPLAYDETGLPLYDRAGGLWIKLTVCGVTRLGYGDGPDPKQRIGDALRNAAMRFGVALDLWSKTELESAHPNGGDPDAMPAGPPAERVRPTAPVEDQWTTPEPPPVVTDAVWFEEWQKKVGDCQTLDALATLYSEALDVRRQGRLTKADFEDAVVLKDVQKQAIERADGDWPAPAAVPA